MSGRRSALALFLFAATCFGVSGLGAWFTAGSVGTWYPTLAKPSWTPPAWVFAPVWTALYSMMAIAAWLVWRKRGWREAWGALGLFVLQLTLNAAWSPLFFGVRSPAAGLVDIVALWFSVAATFVAFFRISPIAGMLLAPYWAWVSFAAALNAAIWSLNR